ncbi:MAG: 3'-5' exonuclease, partial [Pseudomonadota bacterium]
AEIAVRDLGALLSFLATPDDNLSLATALRSPLFGWSEQELFTLAHYRDTEYLWATLRNQQAQYAETVAMLYDLRENIDFLRPYDLIERVLTRHGGRNRLLARLGAEAEDGINALLSQALAYERASVPSLTGFLAWMETDDLEVKRQVDSASNQIRVMTVHGSKGLEAPIVILPECGKRTFQIKDEIISMEGIPVWKMPSTSQPEPMIARIEQMKAAQQEESLRLLYVALTRAEKWLIVAASGELDKAGNDWHQRVEGAMRACGASYLETPVGDGLRLEHGSWDLNAPVPKGSQDAVLSPLPDYFFAPAAKVEAKKQTLSPSELGGAKAIAGEGLDEAMAKAYGAWVHHLLETNGRPQTTPPSSLTVELQNEGIQEAETLLRDPNLSAIFAPSALIEVSITAQLGAARIHGTIDRLIVTDSHVHIIDFKSNRAVPSTVKDCPEGVLRQMGAYGHALKQIYPEHAQSLSILWTRTGHLMPLPHDMVMAALERAQNLDEAGANT